ncbi:hypothetical protein Plhal304r1_c018g0065471 [Plasmopara halstedii]
MLLLQSDRDLVCTLRTGSDPVVQWFATNFRTGRSRVRSPGPGRVGLECNEKPYSTCLTWLTRPLKRGYRTPSSPHRERKLEFLKMLTARGEASNTRVPMVSPSQIPITLISPVLCNI